MSKNDDGGNAFPSVWNGNQAGMSLRDWFAGQALPNVIAVCNASEREGSETMPQMFARKAYAVADALLAARKEPKA